MVTRVLDVSVLLALLWQDHDQHKRARRWLATIPRLATCPLVQLGFARVSSNPSLGYVSRPEQAFSLLRKFLGDERHCFIPDDLGCDERALFTERIIGPNQITDQYLVALAHRHGMVLSTFDAALSRAFANGTDLVELVPHSPPGAP